MKRPVKFGKYYLLDRINVGGMAEVFKAKTFGVEGFEKLVAIKRILPNIAEDEEFIEMFIDEAKIAVQLTHANIAQIFDLGKIDDSYFIALEFVSGKDLRGIFDRFRKRAEIMPIEVACFVIQKTCDGLDFAHRKRNMQGEELGIVHRDISPQNILVSYEGEVKLIDFGIAKAATKATQTQAGILKGKFGYMSPEQVRGLPLDRRSDLFSLGIVLYELVTGERLFVGESDFSTLERVRNVEIIPPTTFNRKIPPDLEKIIMTALAKDPDDRYQWCSDFAVALQKFLLLNFEQPPSSQTLTLFMKDLFAEEIAREKTKLERYAKFTPDVLEREAQGLPPSPPKPPPVPTGEPGGTAEIPMDMPPMAEVPTASVTAALNDVPTNLLTSERTASLPVQPPEAVAAPQPGDPWSTLELASGAPAPPPPVSAPVGGGRKGRAAPLPVEKGMPPGVRRRSTAQLPAASVPASKPLELDEGVRSQRNLRKVAGAAPVAGAAAPKAADPISRILANRTAVIAIIAVSAVVMLGLVVALFTPKQVDSSVPPTVARVNLSVHPPDAMVLLDTVPLKGKSPWAGLDLSPGKHVLQISKSGYNAISKELNLAGGTAVDIHEELPLTAEGKGAITVVTDPPDAVVIIDGATLLNGTPYTFTNIPADVQHVLEVQKSGYEAMTEKFTLKKDETKVMNYTLKPIGVVIKVTSVPAGAEITVDGKSIGFAPVEIKNAVCTKKYAIRAEKAGCSEPQQKIVALSKANCSSGGTTVPFYFSCGGGQTQDTGKKDKGGKKDKKGGAPMTGWDTEPEESLDSGGKGEGTLSINSVPFSTLYIDGKTTGKTTPVWQFKLPSGKYAIMLENTQFSYSCKLKVEIKAGKETKIANFNLKTCSGK